MHVARRVGVVRKHHPRYTGLGRRMTSGSLTGSSLSRQRIHVESFENRYTVNLLVALNLLRINGKGLTVLCAAYTTLVEAAAAATTIYNVHQPLMHKVPLPPAKFYQQNAWQHSRKYGMPLTLLGGRSSRRSVLSKTVFCRVVWSSLLCACILYINNSAGFARVYRVLKPIAITIC